MSSSKETPSSRTKFYGLEDYLDVTLEVKNSDQDGKPVRFASHKVELAKASAKFGQILRNQELMIDENGVKCIQIKDVDDKSMDKMLRHIYNENIEPKEFDAKLLEAAKLYQLTSLFNICLAATIPKKLTHENVLEALKIAYQLELPEEKKSAFQFVWENFEDISMKKEFQQFMVTNPQLMIDFMAKCKGQELEKKVIPFTTNGPNDFEGDPVQVGIITCIQGVQEFTLPDNLPMEAKSVRIIPVPVLQAGLPAATQAFVKIWTEYTGGKCQHFICRARVTPQMDYCQSPELMFPIDRDHRKIFADASKTFFTAGHAGHASFYTITVYLVGYTI